MQNIAFVASCGRISDRVNENWMSDSTCRYYLSIANRDWKSNWCRRRCQHQWLYNKMLQVPTIVSMLVSLAVVSYWIRKYHRRYMPIHMPCTATYGRIRSDLVIYLQLYFYRHPRHGRRDPRNHLNPILNIYSHLAPPGSLVVNGGGDQ